MSAVEPGQRVRLVRTSDPYTDLQPGAEGVVSLVDGMGTVHVHWDNGSRLGLVPDVDDFEIVRPDWERFGLVDDERFAEYATAMYGDGYELDDDGRSTVLAQIEHDVARGVSTYGGEPS